MRFGRFAGYGMVVTADHIETMTTWEWLDQRLAQFGFPVPEPQYRRPILNRRPTAAEQLAIDLRQMADVFEQGHFSFDKWKALIKSHNARKRAAELVNSKAAMSGDGKCRVAAWPKLPRPSSYLPSRENARTNQFINEWFDRMEARLNVSPDNMDPAEVLRITASDIESGTVAFDEWDNVLSALSYLLWLGFQKATDRAFSLNTTNTHGTESHKSDCQSRNLDFSQYVRSATMEKLKTTAHLESGVSS